jgi:hypothetical protein
MAATLRLRPCFALGRRLLAAVLLIAALSWLTAAHAGSNSFRENAGCINPPKTLADDQEDDVTAFFESGAYRQQLAMPLVAVGVLFALAVWAASARGRRKPAPNPLAIRQGRDSVSSL